MEVEIRVQKDDGGNPVPVITRLSVEQLEMLKGLSQSSSWHLYRQILIQAKEGLLHAALAESDPYKTMKIMGQVAGMNFAVNQLVLHLDQYRKTQAKHVDSGTETIPGLRE